VRENGIAPNNEESICIFETQTNFPTANLTGITQSTIMANKNNNITSDNNKPDISNKPAEEITEVSNF